jgi:hypothetical protein
VEDAGGSHYFYHFDQVGGVRALTDEAATVDTIYEYSPFGRMLEESVGSAPNAFTFPATYIKLPDLGPSRLSPTRPYCTRVARYLSRDRETPAPVYCGLAGLPNAVVDPSGRTNGGHAMDGLKGIDSMPPHGRSLTPREKEHVQNAINELKNSPDAQDRADGQAAQKRLDSGNIRVDPDLDSGAERSLDRTYLARDKADPNYAAREKDKKPLDPQNNPADRSATISTAGTLVHEETHHRQGSGKIIRSNLNERCGGKNAAEIEAHGNQRRFLQGAAGREKNPRVRNDIQQEINDVNNMIQKKGGKP